MRQDTNNELPVYHMQNSRDSRRNDNTVLGEEKSANLFFDNNDTTKKPKTEREIIHDYVLKLLFQSLLAGSSLGAAAGLAHVALRKSNIRKPSEVASNAPLVISVEKKGKDNSSNVNILDIIGKRQFLFPTAVGSALIGGLTSWYITEKLLRQISIAEKKRTLEELKNKYKNLIGDVKVQKSIEKVSSIIEKQADAWSLNPLNTAAYLTLLGLWAAKKFSEGVSYQKSKDPDEIIEKQDTAYRLLGEENPPVIVIKRKVFKKSQGTKKTSDDTDFNK